MIDFSLTEEQLSVARMVREFAEREVYPTIKEYDRKQEMNPAVLPRMAKLGILGISLPVRYGGQGFDYLTLGLVCEELERVDSTLRVVMSVHVGLNSLGVFQWGTEEQKQRFLVPQARGERYAAFCLTEPGAGSDVAAMRSTARHDGNDYVINGEKMWISLATRAHHFLWFAKTDLSAEPHEGITAFMVESDMPGLTKGDIHGKLGVRAGSTGWVNCDNVRVPAANRIGEEGEGFRIAMSCLDNGRFTVASGATGLIRASLEASIKYAKERETFGRPIAHHQLVKQKIAWMQQWYDCARLLYLRAGWLKNQGLRNSRETSMAKWYATDMSFKAAHEALQVHGAYGYSDEYDVERYLRNSRGAIIYEGTSEIHQLMQAGYALGERQDRPLRCELPAYDPAFWTEE
ncbi:MAG: acyl-CoA dehydrogenase family protein [Chloroflexi bacterium]|nr:acyl-CoA dehydrogenase family protein [Chloroflexota bacterium]MCI0575892.1 acyl-CoA dehydrogenase family protein [Chloroflexota bacterium]MCI0648550.1 acyl-CoA dehydrogenase family protein [Chloroflexota bacterium]MCI0727313.1 acyl-CoA dehydrogenase family protein [Chloroflexota bacterium]